MTQKTDFDIAIIGGGVGGLAVAWNYYEQAMGVFGTAGSVSILEGSPNFGGNADTSKFTFGTGPGSTAPFNRWADLGVNDFNATAYTKIVGVMNTIGYKKGVDYLNLEDSTTYYTGDNRHCFTDNGNDWWGTAMDPALQKSAANFMTQAGSDAANNPVKFADYTIQQYIDEQSKVYGWDPRLGPLVIYPRINGMYFVSENGPLNMPFLAVMHYYAIQEGAGGKPADRNYFVGGSSTWINDLVNYMKTKMGQSLTFMENFKASVAWDANAGHFVINADPRQKQPSLTAKYVVFATHADETLKACKTGLPEGSSSILARVGYNNGISVVHTDSRLLPVNRSAWSTYNIVIHEPGSAALKPYVINYVANRHQNDAANPIYNKFGLPEFFVSINPQLPIPENMILKDLNGNPVMKDLRHNNYDFDTMSAQHDIDALQGIGNIYHAGGWTHGSGLHEECWSQGEYIGTLLTKVVQGTEASPVAAAKKEHIGTFIGNRLARNAASG